VSGQLHLLATLPQEITSILIKQVGPRAGLDILEKGIISCPFTGENQSTQRKIYPSAPKSTINPT
jgi:hypothetical protein